MQPSRVVIIRRGPTPSILPRYRIRFRDRLGPFDLWHEEKKYVLWAPDHAVKRFFQLLTRFVRNADTGMNLRLLLALRKDFREIQAKRPIPGLVWCVKYGYSDARRLAIWLLGRIGNRYTATLVSSLGNDGDVRVRKEVAKALRRLKAWVELREIAAREDDPVVRRFATQAEIPHREFSERMTRFLDNDVEVVEQRHEADPATKSLHVNTTIGDGTPPRSRWYIRLILEHIRWLVGKHVTKLSGKQAKPKPKH